MYHLNVEINVILPFTNIRIMRKLKFVATLREIQRFHTRKKRKSGTDDCTITLFVLVGPADAVCAEQQTLSRTRYFQRLFVL